MSVVDGESVHLHSLYKRIPNCRLGERAHVRKEREEESGTVWK